MPLTCPVVPTHDTPIQDSMCRIVADGHEKSNLGLKHFKLIYLYPHMIVIFIHVLFPFLEDFEFFRNNFFRRGGGGEARGRERGGCSEGRGEGGGECGGEGGRGGVEVEVKEDKGNLGCTYID